MFKTAILTSYFVLLSGCSLYNDRSIPTEVSIMPNDCANQRMMLNWLEYQIGQEQSLLSNKGIYAREQRALKHKKWDFKYACNPVN